MINNYYKGIICEYLAIVILFFKGYTILKRRYRTKFGEIDILTKKKNNLIAIEVKARHNNLETSEYVSNYQLNRIKNSLNYFVQHNNKYINFNITIEIILFINYFNYKHYK